MRDQVKTLVGEAEPPPRAVLFDAVAQDDLDVTGADILKKLFAELRERGIDVYLAEVHAPVREFGDRVGLLEAMAEDHIFPTVPAAVVAFEESTRRSS